MESKAFENHMINRSIQRGDVEEITPTMPPKRIDSKADRIEPLRLSLPP
jgi:hypothetical protein